MNKHAQRQQIALKAHQYRQSQRAGTSASQKQPPSKRFLRQALLILLVAILAIGGFALLHASLNASTSPKAARTSGSGSSELHISPPSGTPATPQVRTGIFAPGTGGPIPVPANVLKPSNSARVVLNNEIYSIYAGAMTRQPEVGVLAVLQENDVSGQQSLHLYQSPRHLGSLTILSLQQNTVHFEAADGSKGSFDLLTDQFQFS